MSATTERLRCRRVMFIRRVRAKLRKENHEHFTFRHHCRNCGKDADGGRGLNQSGFCTVLCEAEHAGAV